MNNDILHVLTFRVLSDGLFRGLILGNSILSRNQEGHDS